MDMKSLGKEDFPLLFDFEQRNWEYFKQFIPERPSCYLQYESFCKAQQDLLQEQEEGKALFYLLYSEETIVARVNLNEIDWDNNIAELGYRTFHNATGKGVATEAVKRIIEKALEQGLQTIRATVAQSNPASERVLIKNGFEYLQTKYNAYEHNGEMLDFNLYQKIIK